MGLFGCSHVWKKYGRKREGIQQYRCRKCGRMKNKRVFTLFCMHKWRLDRRHRGRVLKCKKCGRIREATPARNEYPEE